MTDTARAVFEAHATTYDDDLRRRLIPPYDAFYGTAVAALELAGAPLRRVLDLGAGTGLLSARIAAAYPDAELVLLDGAPAMLDRARARVGELGAAGADGGAGGAVGGAGGAAGAPSDSRIELRVGDLRDPLPAAPGGEPYDAIVSALAIHHLDDDAKRDLFAHAHAALRPGGVFVNAEQVLAPTAALEKRAWTWHREASAALGTTPAEWAGALERMAVDRCATVEDQLAWLRAAGFEDVDCPLREQRFAVIVARRARGWRSAARA